MSLHHMVFQYVQTLIMIQAQTKLISEKVNFQQQQFADVLKEFADFTGKYLLTIPTTVFSREICKILKNTFSYRAPPVAPSEFYVRETNI